MAALRAIDGSGHSLVTTISDTLVLIGLKLEMLYLRYTTCLLVI